MIIINKTPLQNGAYQNQISSDELPIPDGWVAIPNELEDIALQFLPFLDITIEGGVIISITENSAAKNAQITLDANLSTLPTIKDRLSDTESALVELAALLSN